MIDDLLKARAMSALLSGGGGHDKKSAPHEFVAGFKAITDLKPGDTVRLKYETSQSFPKVGEPLHVYRKLEPELILGITERGSPIRRLDFTAIALDDDGEPLEYAFDSRMFEKI